MESLKQRCRAKHQVLILKCYPKLPKNSSPEEIKPNGSELSYLLYYASSRRSKLTKVGTFLEKRTASDLYKVRTSSVQITLQILTAFLNNPGIGGAGPQGFGLFAPYVLRIIRDVLKEASETVLVEAAVPTWDSFCRHQDHVALSADRDYRSLFAEVVRLWAGYAAKEQGVNKKAAVTGRIKAGVTDSIRLRSAGLQALKSVTDSETLGTEAGRQLDIVMPVVLQNLIGTDANLTHLLRLLGESEAFDKEKAQKPTRTSMGTTRSTFDNGDVRAAEGTTAEADKLADEEASVLALQCLKSIFATENRQQTRSATSCLLDFIATQQPTTASRKSTSQSTESAWSIKIFEIVCSWTPVQDRFIALFNAVGTLVRIPMVEDQLDRQLLLARILSHILGSDINLIGLSVMDILLALLQHVLLILQLGTSGTVLPGQGDITSSDEDLKGRKSMEQPQKLVMEVVKTPSAARVQLLGQLQQCIANLAVHVYYTDQIQDMVSAILSRLKPSPAATHNPAISASAIEDPASAAADVATQSMLKERPNTDGFFSFDTAREVALQAVRDVITVANSDSADSSYVSENRNGVPISVWEGTQWLLKDNSFSVRRAYVNALCTWLRLELRKTNLRLEGEAQPSERKKKMEGQTISRAASIASNKNRGAARRSRSTFLQLLHLAIYENALMHANDAEGESDILLLHLLLANLSKSLGINAVKVGMPMIFALQDDIAKFTTVGEQIRIGSLVYGYFWTLSEVFELEGSPTSREIFNEISKRRDSNAWVDGIHMPPMPADQITQTKFPVHGAAPTSAMLTPFQHRSGLVDGLQSSYFASLLTPPNSPPTSPSRSFSLPALSAEMTSATPGAETSQNENKFDQSTTDELMGHWSRDELLASLAATGPKPPSLAGSARVASGSRSPPGIYNNINNGSGYGSIRNDHRHLLSASSTFPLSRTRSRDASPRNSTGYVTERNPSYSGSATSFRDRKRISSATQRNDEPRRLSNSTSRSRRAASASRSSRVDELKRVLAGGGTPNEGLSSNDASAGEDTGSDSLVDVDESFMTFDDDAATAPLSTQNIEARDHGLDTISDDEGGEGFRTPPQEVATYTLTGGEGDKSIIDAAFSGASQTVTSGLAGLGFGSGITSDDKEVDETPALRLNSDVMPAYSHQEMTNGSKTSTGTGKKGLSDLLSSIDDADDEGDGGSGLGRPPY